MKLVLHFIDRSRPSIVHHEWDGIVPPPNAGDKVVYNLEIFMVVSRTMHVAFEPRGTRSSQGVNAHAEELHLYLLPEKP
jgi:hypothetical protein